MADRAQQRYSCASAEDEISEDTVNECEVLITRILEPTVSQSVDLRTTVYYTLHMASATLLKDDFLSRLNQFFESHDLQQPDCQSINRLFDIFQGLGPFKTGKVLSKLFDIVSTPRAVVTDRTSNNEQAESTNVVSDDQQPTNNDGTSGHSNTEHGVGFLGDTFIESLSLQENDGYSLFNGSSTGGEETVGGDSRSSTLGYSSASSELRERRLRQFQNQNQLRVHVEGEHHHRNYNGVSHIETVPSSPSRSALSSVTLASQSDSDDVRHEEPDNNSSIGSSENATRSPSTRSTTRVTLNQLEDIDEAEGLFGENIGESIGAQIQDDERSTITANW